ncbi:hypothetical protein PGT21_014706 [Puccinia graminis f. sp. tritici]|uniref:Uncharacterized protein n=1 Tax=Puccinia graminis f. sp. tritici TaxID=56615 RepID=A0A5B0NFZ5_PUCGR|nr:hypothetical protein PGT21_014706 [Puccinia graminis f. sp. tritici]
MVTTRSAACTAGTTIAAARQLRHQRRARTAEQDILGQTQPGPAKSNKRQRRATSAKTKKTTPTPTPTPTPVDQEADMLQPEPPMTQENGGVAEPGPTQQSSTSSAVSETTVRPANMPQQSPAADPSPEPPQAEPPKRWFGPIGNISLPNPTVPIFKPTESLFHFSAGLPAPKPEVKPFEADRQNTEAHGFPGMTGLPQASTSSGERRHEAITKAAAAVMAHMNGHDASRSDYVSILDGMLEDPEMRTELPPVLVEQYDAAAQGEHTTLYNGALVEKFIHATKRATDVVAKILMTNKNARRDRQARAARPRAEPSAYHTPVPTPFSAGPPEPSPPTGDYTTDLGDQMPMASSQSSQMPPPLFTYPLTEANLNRRAETQNAKNQAREALGHRDDERSGVMRNSSKRSVRAAPYPRPSPSDNRPGHGLSAEMAAVYPHGVDVNDESGYSVYSASTGLAHQQSEAQRMASTMLDNVKKMEDPNTYESQCRKEAEGVLAEIERSRGADAAARIRTGFDLMSCYELVKKTNVNFLSEALLEHISDSSRPPNNSLPPPPPSQNQPQPSGSMSTPRFEDIRPPPQTPCLHPQYGLGTLGFARVFKPAAPSFHRTIVLDTPMRPPPPP